MTGIERITRVCRGKGNPLCAKSDGCLSCDDYRPMTGIELITAERKRQIEKECWTAEHDRLHMHGELAIAASCYALPKRHRTVHQNTYKGITRLLPMKWPWDAEWWKPTPDDRVRELVKAGALIAAEIDRLQAEANNDTN
jgi:hypothetical protein